MSLLEKGARVGRALIAPALIGAGIVACDTNEIRDIEFNPVNCSGEPKLSHLEVFLKLGDKIEILSTTIEAENPGELDIEPRNIRVRSNGEFEIFDLNGDAHVTIFPETVDEADRNGTLLKMDWDCNADDAIE
ncbi:MAG: hypothetical protein AAB675_04990 [Patescibacteria group bacterium]